MVELRLVADAAARGPARYVRLDPADAPAVDATAASLETASPPAWSAAHRLALEGAADLGLALGAQAIEVAIEPADDATDAALASCGASRIRAIRQLRRPLPLDAATRALGADPSPTDVRLRRFRPGTDDEVAWLRVNARAFAWHPEQAFVDADDLARQLAEPWFDPDGFLLAQRGDEVVGFCWTKVHEHAATPLGEIYAIGIDPGAQGLGLGRRLVVAGLDHLHAVGVPMAMLWVEADNGPALALYDALGFDRHHDKRYYLRTVAS